MSKTKSQKKEIVKKISDKISKANIIVFTSFSKENEKGLKVNEAQKLRSDLRKVESEYMVSKKRLIRVAFNNASYSDIPGLNVEQFEGSLGLVFGYSDVVSAPKTIYEFARKNSSLHLLGAIIDKEYIDLDRLIQLAKLPSREVLFSMVVGMVQYPISGFVSVLQGNLRNLILALKQIKVSNS